MFGGADPSIVLTPRNQDSRAPWSVVQDVTFRCNVARHVAAGVNLLGYDDGATSLQTSRIRIVHNVFAYGRPTRGFVFRNTLARHNAYGIIGDNQGVGNSSIDLYFPGASVTGNVFAGGPAASYPAGNTFPSVASWLAQLVDPASGDFRLTATSTYRGAGTDGADLGADTTTIAAAAAIALSGNRVGGGSNVPTPVPPPTPTPTPTQTPTPTTPPTTDPTPTIPQTPAAPSALAATVSGSTVALTWTPPAGDAPTNYFIEAGSAPGAADLAQFVTNSVAPSLVLTSVPAGVYHVRVRALNATAIGPPSNDTVVAVGGGALQLPGAPGNLTSIVAGSDVTLQWSGASDAIAYVIEAGSAPGLRDLANIGTGSPATTFHASGVGAGTYYVRVRGWNSLGVGAASNEIAVVVR